jgi:hypothetical protein
LTQLAAGRRGDRGRDNRGRMTAPMTRSRRRRLPDRPAASPRWARPIRAASRCGQPTGTRKSKDWVDGTTERCRYRAPRRLVASEVCVFAATVGIAAVTLAGIDQSAAG